VYWQYQTILFEFRKDGLLGDKYIDDEEVENLLNEHGNLGWELVNVTPVQEGLLAFLKKERVVSKQQGQEMPGGVHEARPSGQPSCRQPAEHVQVRDRELVNRPERKRHNSLAKGDSNLVGGIKIT